MKTITNRTELCTILSTRSMPVVKLDVADRNDLRVGKTLVGLPWSYNGKTYVHEATLQFYPDEGLKLSSGGTMISNSFTYSDLMERVDIAQAPLLEPGKPFILLLVDTFSKRLLTNPLVLTLADSKVDIGCMTPIRIADAKEFNNVYGSMLSALTGINWGAQA